MTQFTLHTIDLPALHRHTIGFEQLFEQLNQTFASNKSDNKYPPHNVIQLDETHFVIELAVAGFDENEIDIELKENILIVKGEHDNNNLAEVTYHYKGISTRSFERKFPLGKHIEVRGATVQNGILAIALEQLIPEEQQGKKIAITFAK